MLEGGKVEVCNGEGALNDGPADNVAGSAGTKDEEVGTSPNCGVSICMSPSVPREFQERHPYRTVHVLPCCVPDLCDVPGFCEGVMNSM